MDPEGQGERSVAVQRERRQPGRSVGAERQRRLPVRPLADVRAALESDRMRPSLHPKHGAVGGVEIEPHPLRRPVEGRPQGPVGVGRQPLGEGGVNRRRSPRDLRFRLRRFRAEVVPALPIRRLGNDQDRRRVGNVAVHHVLRRVPEEGGQRVELALRDRVELVVVAGRAANRQAEVDAADSLRPVLGVDRLVLLRHDAALVRRDVVALEAGGDELIERRLGEQVAGDLLHRERVERLVLVERVDDLARIIRGGLDSGTRGAWRVA